MSKVHILEGTDAGGTRIFRCGRRQAPGTGGPSVGCAVLKTHGKYVSCAACIAITKKRYGVVLSNSEETKP